MVFDLGNDDPNSNAEALGLIRDNPTIATRTFNSSLEEGGTLRLYEGHLATVNEREERVRCIKIMMYCSHQALSRSLVHYNGFTIHFVQV